MKKKKDSRSTLLLSDGLAGYALTAGVWIICRLGLLASDLTAIRSLLPLSSPQRHSQPASKSSAGILGLTPWMLGFLCGAMVVGTTVAALRKQNRL